MRFIVHIILAVAIHTIGQLVPFTGTLMVRWIPLFIVLLALVPYALVMVASRAGRIGKFRRSAWLGRIAHFSGVVAYGIAVLGVGWIDAVRNWTGQSLDFAEWPEPAVLLTFAPFVIYQIACIHAESILHAARGVHVWRTFRFQVRMFASTLTPLLLFLLIALGLATNEVLRVHIESVRLIETVYMCIMVVLFTGLMPSLLSNAWDMRSLPSGQARELFREVAERADFRSRDVMLWNTGQTVVNAAIVGVSPGTRVVLLSDSLLAMLSSRELACVYGHEIGHCKRHHVAIFFGWAITFFVGGILLASWLAPGDEWIGMAIVGFMMFSWFFCFGWMSRRFELEADLYSAQLTGDPEALIQALERVAGGARHRGGWRHFSTARRVEFLNRATFDEVFRMRFLRKIRLIGKAGLALGALVSIIGISLMVRDYGADRIQARLNLGQYDASWAAQASEQEVEASLSAELLLAASISEEDGSRVPIQRLESGLQDTLRAGDLEQAQPWARLLARRGSKPERLLPELLEQLRSNPEQSGRLEDWPSPWRDYALEGLGMLEQDDAIEQ